MIKELSAANRVNFTQNENAPTPIIGLASSKMNFHRDEVQQHIQVLKRKRHATLLSPSRSSYLGKETADEYTMSCSSHDDSEARDEPDQLCSTGNGISDSTYQHHLVTPTTTADSHIYEDDDDFAEEMALVKRFRNSHGRDSRRGEESELASSPFHLNDYEEELEGEPCTKSVNFLDQLGNDDDQDEDNDCKSSPFLSMSPRSLFHHPAILRATAFCEDSSDAGSSCGEHDEYLSSSSYQGFFSDPPECASRSPSPPILRRENRHAESATLQVPHRPAWLAPMPSSFHSWALPHPKTTITPLFSFKGPNKQSSSRNENEGQQPFLFGNVNPSTKFHMGSS